MTLSELFNTARGGLIEGLVGIGLGLGIAKAISLYKRRKGEKNIQDGIIDAPIALQGLTRYEPSGRINPKTGREFYHQKVRTYAGHVYLREIFREDAGSKFLEYIEKARVSCTANHPVIAEHLPALTRDTHLPKRLDFLKKQWKNFFSARLNDGYSAIAARDTLGDRQVLGEDTLYAVLIYEPDAASKLYRILFLEDKMLEPKNFPAFEDVLFENPDNTFPDTHDPNHPQASRYRTHIAIANVLKEQPWIKAASAIGVLNGKRRSVPKLETGEVVRFHRRMD